MKMRYLQFMRVKSEHSTDNQRLREIAALLKNAYSLSPIEDFEKPDYISICDMVMALDNPELRDILCEIKDLQFEQLQRLERLLSRHADNDT